MMKYFATLILLSITGTVCAQPSTDATPESTPQATLEWREMINGMDPSDPALQQEILKLEQAGTAEANAMLGYLYLNGKGVERDYDRVFEIAEKAAWEGNGFAHYLLGRLYSDEQFAEADPERAVYHYQISADRGDIYGLNNLGTRYYEGTVVEMDIEQAIHWFKLAGEKGNHISLYNIAQAYYFGRGEVNKNLIEAASWYRQSAELGYIPAQNRLGDMYSSGEGVTQDTDAAHDWYLQAAEQGDVSAQLKLGEWYHASGGGEPGHTDTRQAAEWFAKAGDQGNAEGQYMAGYLYHLVDPFGERMRDAVQYLTRAAESRHAGARSELGKMILQILERNDGAVDPQEQYDFLVISPENAKYWLRLAANEGVDEAAYHMGRLYDEGYLMADTGSSADAEAYAWFDRVCSPEEEQEFSARACNRMQRIESERIMRGINSAIVRYGHVASNGWEPVPTNVPGVAYINRSGEESLTDVSESLILMKRELNKTQEGSSSETAYNQSVEGFLVDCTGNRVQQIFELRYLDDEFRNITKSFSMDRYADAGAWQAIYPGDYRYSMCR